MAEILRPIADGPTTNWGSGDWNSVKEAVTSPDDPNAPTWGPGEFLYTGNTSDYAILEPSESNTTLQVDVECGNTSYSNVEKIEVFAYLGSPGGGALAADADILVDIDDINDQQTLAAGGSAEDWYSKAWTGSWTQAEVNAMVIEFTLDTTGGWGQGGIAACYLEVTEETASDLSASITESMSIAEALTMSLPLPGVTVTESMSISESIGIDLPLAAAVTDSLTILESIGETLPLPANIAQVVTLNELITVIKDLADISVAEAMTIVESIQASLSGALTISASVDESMTIAEAITLDIPIPISVVDSMAVAEAIVLNLPVAVSPTETMTVAEVLQAQIDLPAEITEQMTLSELITVALEGGVSLTDVMTIAEAITVLFGDLLPTVTDTLTINELILCSLSGVALARKRGLLLGVY